MDGSSLAAGAPGLVLAVGAGVLSFLSPCVLPLLPAYMGYISGQSAGELSRGADDPARRRQVLGRTVAFALGLILAFTALGASASLIGSWLAAYRTLLARVAGLVVLAFGLHMMGLLHIPLLHREFRPGLNSGGGRGPGPVLRGGAAGALLMGFAFALGWTPCVGPMLGGILVLASQEKTVGQGMLLLFAYGLGLGVPFVLAGLAVDRALGTVAVLRRHIGTVSKVSGALLVIMGLLLVTDRLSALGLWLNRVL